MNAFLDQHGWAQANRTPLVQDASSRSYTRLERGAERAILMQDPEGDVSLFARLSEHLTGLGLSAPRIFAQDPPNGMLLIEDLGDDLVARIAQTPDSERDLYLLATDALICLHRHAPPKDLPVANAQRLADMVDLAFTEYCQAPEARPAATQAFLPILQQHAEPTNVMVLRDYHAENILHLPDRKGVAQAGLLDFQDALQGHIAYDLASLLKDARRDVRTTTAEACIQHYVAQTGADPNSFCTSLAVLGAQRNLRILGVFARLARLRGKPHYVDLIPRVWTHLQDDLRHPVLAPLKSVVDAALPAPDAAHLQQLRHPCPTP